MLQNIYKLAEASQEESNISKDLTEKFLRLFPSWQIMIATLLAVILLLIVFTKLLWKPILKMHNERVEYIQNNIDSAIESNKNAEKLKNKAIQELELANKESENIIEQAKLNAQKLHFIEIEKTKKEVERIYYKASQNIENNIEKFEKEKKEAIVNVSIEIARKILNKEINKKISEQIINDYIESE